jgi:hypothetical protein
MNIYEVSISVHPQYLTRMEDYRKLINLIRAKRTNKIHVTSAKLLKQNTQFK